MKWFRVFLALVALGLGAAIARADPSETEFDDPAYYASEVVVGVVGEPFPSGSWSQTFVLKTSLPAITTTTFCINAGLDRIKGSNVTGTSWELPTPVGNFAAYPYSWSGAIVVPWQQTSATPTVFRADGHSDDPGSAPGDFDKGLQFNLNFIGEPDPIQFDLQLYSKVYDKSSGSCLGYQERTHLVFEWDGCQWSGGEHGGCIGPLPQLTGVPEPLSMAFLGSVFLGVVGFRLRSRRKEEKK